MKKIGLSSAALVMAFCYFSGLHPLPASAASKTETLVLSAEKAGKVLSDDTTTKATGTKILTREYKDALSKYNTAITVVNKLSKGKTKTSYSTRLNKVKTEINYGYSYNNAVKDGQTLAGLKVKVDNDSKSSTVTTQLLKDYAALSSAYNHYSSTLTAVNKTTRSRLKSMYQDPATNDVSDLNIPVKIKNATLTGANLLKTNSTSSKLAEQYKIIVYNMDLVKKSSYKTQLIADTNKLSSSIPTKLNTGSLATLVEMEQLDGYVSIGKSNKDVPGLYKSLTSEINGYSPSTDRNKLQNRFSTIMNRLKVSPKDIKTMLTKAAINAKIPPEIVKSIALEETGSLKQFNSDGSGFSSGDKGYGIMQVTPLDTPDTNIDWDRVQYDMQYNIDTGVQILLQKWGYNNNVLPVVNNHNMNSLEDWYFAVMAYNGVSSSNSPGNGKAYQDKVYRYLYDDALLESEHFTNQLPIIKEPVIMTNDAQFNSMSYTSNYKHVSTQMHIKGDTVTIPAGVNLRQEPSTSAANKPLRTSQKVSVSLASGPIEDNSPSNMYCWYQVSIKGKTYYVASINLQ